MKITFCGASQEVTGSNFLIEADNKKFLVDCGLIQGRMIEEERNHEDFIYDPKEIDFMLLTHAHIDHSGRIPKLYKDGFRGNIYTTKATMELCNVMLRDSAYIQESEAEWRNRKRKREGREELSPIYDNEDVEEVMKQFKAIPYFEFFDITENIRVRFNDAGHILGSSIIEIWVTENGTTTKMVFSGDIGNNDIPLLQPPTPISSADYLIMESTYGNRLHKSSENKAEEFLNIVIDTLRRGGNVIIPSFAVGRTQEILFELNKIKDSTDDEGLKEKYKELMKAPVYVDSPLAISTTEIFKDNMELFEKDVQDLINSGDNPLEFDGLEFTPSVEESRKLNETHRPCIIISASGMCDVGRIRHHLKHNLWNPKNTILFVGYQAPYTLGRELIDGKKRVTLFGEEITVNAEIRYLDQYSGHADKNGLLEFIDRFNIKPKKIFLVHGQLEAQLALAKEIEDKYKIETYIPAFGDKFKIDEYCEKLDSPVDITKIEQRERKILNVQELEENMENIRNITKDLNDNILKTKANDCLNEEEGKTLEELLEEINKYKNTVEKLLKDQYEKGCKW